MLRFWVVVSISLIGAVKSNNECDSEMLEECLSSGGLQIGYRESLPDEEFLNKKCGPAEDALKCLKGVIEECPELGEIIGTVEQIDSGLNFLNSMCDQNSNLRRGYLENLECYNNALPAVIKCAINGKEILRNFSLSVNDTTDTQRDFYPHCLLRLVLLNCLLKESTALCGAESAEPLTNMTVTIVPLVKDASCPEEDILLDWENRFAQYLQENGLELRKRKK